MEGWTNSASPYPVSVPVTTHTQPEFPTCEGGSSAIRALIGCTGTRAKQPRRVSCVSMGDAPKAVSRGTVESECRLDLVQFHERIKRDYSQYERKNVSDEGSVDVLGRKPNDDESKAGCASGLGHEKWIIDTTAAETRTKKRRATTTLSKGSISTDLVRRGCEREKKKEREKKEKKYCTTLPVPDRLGNILNTRTTAAASS
jgi:hypothetical protein